MKPIDVACAIIINKKEILVARRSENMSLPLKWEFPGGKIQKNESDEECLLREIKEELNIVIKIERRLERVVFDYGNFVINLIPFLAIFEFGEIKLLEHKEIKWVEKEDLYSLDWAPADIDIVKQIMFIDLC